MIKYNRGNQIGRMLLIDFLSIIFTLIGLKNTVLSHSIPSTFFESVLPQRNRKKILGVSEKEPLIAFPGSSSHEN